MPEHGTTTASASATVLAALMPTHFSSVTWIRWVRPTARPETPEPRDALDCSEPLDCLDCLACSDSLGALGSMRTVKWLCRAEALDLRENEDRVRTGADMLCMEYRVRDGVLVACGGAHFPRVVRLERDIDGGHRFVAQEEPPDGAGYAAGEENHISFVPEVRLDDAAGTPAALETAARAHFGLPAGAPVENC